MVYTITERQHYLQYFVIYNATTAAFPGSGSAIWGWNTTVENHRVSCTHQLGDIPSC